MQETASTWSPECGKSSTWKLAPESDSTLGNIKFPKYTQILAQNSWEYKIPRIHTNIGTKHFGKSNPLEYTLISAQNNWEYQIPQNTH